MVNPVHQIRALTEKTHPPLLPADKKNSKLSKLLKVYLSEEDIERIWQAYRFSDKAHSGQKRKILN